MQKKALKRFLTDKQILILLLFVGTISWSVTMVKSGLIYAFGMGFWGANGHDGVWHIALINSLSRNLTVGNFNFQMPVFAGYLIKNYHLGFDLILAVTHNVTRIPTVNLYFQIFPPILALLIGITCYLFVYEWKKSKTSALWAVFFVYFGGDISWIFSKGESTFWAQQGISTLINPPLALSLISIFLGMYLFLRIYNLKFTILDLRFLITVFLFGSLLEVKAYAGVLVLVSLLVVSIWQVLREKKYGGIKVFFGSCFVTVFLFFVLNRGSENVFVFQPFWFLQNLFNLDRFSIPRLASAITNYNLAHNWLKLTPALMLAFGVFWVGNMGTRLVKEFEVISWIKRPKEIGYMEVFITVIIVTGVGIPMLLLQKGTSWNTIQFFYYSLVFSGILAGVGMERVLKNAKSSLIFGSLVVLLTIPTALFTLSEVYLPGRPPAKVSTEELSALNFLSRQSNGVVLTYPFDEMAAKLAVNNPPRPLYLYDSTAYVSAFSDKTVFLEDQVNLDITNFDWTVRRRDVFDKFLNTLDTSVARRFLKDSNIKYVYFLKNQRAKLEEKQLGIIKIFENGEVNIFKVL